MEETVIKLALSAYEARLQGLPADARDRFIALQQRQEVSRNNDDKLRIIRNLYKSLECCIGKPDPRIDTIYPAGKAWSDLTDEEKLFIKQDVEDRRAYFWERIGKIADEQISVLIEAVEIGVSEHDDGRQVLEHLREIQSSRRLPALQTEEPAAVDGAATDRINEPVKGDGAAAKRKAPGGFIGFCLEKIKVMPTEEREKFLSVNSGDSSFYDLPRKWNSEWESTGANGYSNPGQGVSKAKKQYRELNPELKN